MMSRLFTATTLLVCTSTALFAAPKTTVTPGSRTVILAHNAYPDRGKYADRIDRAIASGAPLIVEEDLAWINGHSYIVHGAKNASSDDPTLETYFFPKIKPVMEQALRDGNKGNWPLVTLYLDIKNDPPEHLQYINQLLDQYNAWLTTAPKGDDLAEQSPMKFGPMMILVEDKQNDIKQKFFYDDLPVGGNIRVFGSYTKPVENPAHLPKLDFINSLVSVPMNQITTQKADNYHRWWGVDWAYVEKGGEEHHGVWGKEQVARLNEVIRYGHGLGYLMGFYCLDGFTATENQGWEDEYNFGSATEAMPRWTAAIRAHADILATDQYEVVAKQIRTR